MLKKYGWIVCMSLGCGSTSMTATGEPQTAREANCSFDILTATPLLGYREVGTIDVSPGGYGVNVFRDLGDFKEHIAPNVCKLGGDAAIASANGYGMYIKATVLKRIEASAPAPSAPVTGPAMTEAPKKHGCEFDTQCKGDRICIDGHCEAPAAAATPSAAPESVAAAPTPGTVPATPTQKKSVPTPSTH